MSAKKSRNKVYHVEIPRPAVHMFQMRKWCEEQLGPGGRNAKYDWRFGWTGDKNIFYFRNQEDVTAFVMRFRI